MSERWQWLKRYRVWEANRKVFVEPENWLEPEAKNDDAPPLAPEQRSRFRPRRRPKSEPYEGS